MATQDRGEEEVMKKRIAPVLEIQVDITQPTRCTTDCQFLAHIDRDKFCKLFGKTLRVVKGKSTQLGPIYYIHRCRQCRDAEVW